MWGIHDHTKILEFSENQSKYITVAITLDDKYIISGSSNKTMKIWDIHNK